MAKASLLLSIIGITNTFGRIACGYFADFPQVNALLVNNICLVISTIAVSLTPFCNSYGAYITMAIFFGVAVCKYTCTCCFITIINLMLTYLINIIDSISAGYISLTSIILVDLLGLDKLTNAFGLLILFRGVAAIVGTPLAGALYDATGTYSIPFYVAGAFFAISALTSFLAPCMKRFSPQDEPQMGDGDVLTPIDEDEEEDEPITMGGGGGNLLPKIVETASSPMDPNEKEIKQIESVL